MREESVTRQVAAAVNEGRMDGGSFFGSIAAGTLLGLGLDAWLDTAPILVIVGIVLGSYSGFAKAWHMVKAQPEHPAVTRPPVEDDA